MENHRVKRRPIRARDTKWAAAVAQWLTRSGLKPNQISILSIVCAALAGACLLLAPTQGVAIKIALLVGAAVFIQLRLLCNLFDGMVAVESGFQTKSGEIYNELPDRFSDVIVLVCAGYSIPSDWVRDLGWAAGALAVITAYVRTLGASAGTSQHFCGPMAKQQRMMTIMAASLIGVVETITNRPPRVMIFALGIVVTGCVITIVRRTNRIVKELESR